MTFARSSGATARWVWYGVRLPALGLLVILEPVVSLICGAGALMGLLTTILFKMLGAPHFPFWTMLGISLGLFFARLAYAGLIRVLSH